MSRGQRTIMPRIHRLQHVECLGTATLSNNDPFRSHSQTVPHQVRCGNLTFSFNVGRACFETHNVFLLQLQFGCILDRYDPVLVGYKTGQSVQQGRFSWTGDRFEFDRQVQEAEGLFGLYPMPWI